MNIETVLVPTDFSPDATKALATATDLAKSWGAKIVVLHAYQVDIPVASPIAGGGYVFPPSFYDDIRIRATANVEKLAKKLAEDGLDAIGMALHESPSSAILDQAKALPADLIVMGTRGLTGFKHILLGSIAERVVRMAPCPVLTVKCNE